MPYTWPIGFRIIIHLTPQHSHFSHIIFHISDCIASLILNGCGWAVVDADEEEEEEEEDDC